MTFIIVFLSFASFVTSVQVVLGRFVGGHAKIPGILLLITGVIGVIGAIVYAANVYYSLAGNLLVYAYVASCHMYMCGMVYRGVLCLFNNIHMVRVMGYIRNHHRTCCTEEEQSQ